jgi:hypothetical protein
MYYAFYIKGTVLKIENVNEISMDLNYQHNDLKINDESLKKG